MNLSTADPLAVAAVEAIHNGDVASLQRLLCVCPLGLQQQAKVCLSQIAFWAERRFAFKTQGATNFSNGVAVRFCLREFDD